MFSTSPNLDGIIFILTFTTDVIKLMLQMFQNVNCFGWKLCPLSKGWTIKKIVLHWKQKSWVSFWNDYSQRQDFITSQLFIFEKPHYRKQITFLLKISKSWHAINKTHKFWSNKVGVCSMTTWNYQNLKKVEWRIQNYIRSLPISKALSKQIIWNIQKIVEQEYHSIWRLTAKFNK